MMKLDIDSGNVVGATVLNSDAVRWSNCEWVGLAKFAAIRTWIIMYFAGENANICLSSAAGEAVSTEAPESGIYRIWNTLAIHTFIVCFASIPFACKTFGQVNEL